MGTQAELDWLLANGMGWLVDSMGGPEAFLSPEPTPTSTSTSTSTSPTLPPGPTAEELAKAEADRIALEQAAEAAYYEEERRRLEAEEAARRAQDAAIEEDERQAEIRRLQETQTTYYEPVQEQEPVYSGLTYYYASNGAAFTSPAERDGYENNLQAIYAAQEAAARAAQETAARAAQEEAAAKAAQEAAANLAAQEAAKKAADEAAAKTAEEAAAKIVSSQTTSSGTSIGTGQTMALIDNTPTATTPAVDSYVATLDAIRQNAQEGLAKGISEADLRAYGANIGLSPEEIAYALGQTETLPTKMSDLEKVKANDIYITSIANQLGDTSVSAGEQLALSNPSVLDLAENVLAQKGKTSTADLAKYGTAIGLNQDLIDYLLGTDTTMELGTGNYDIAGNVAKAVNQELKIQDAIRNAKLDPTQLTPSQLASVADAFTSNPESLEGLLNFIKTGVRPPVTPPVTSTTTTDTGTKVTSPVTTTGANFAGLSGLSALANATQTQTQNQGTQQPPPGRVDFSKLPPQLRMAGQYADYLAMPTADKGPKLSTYRKVGDATATGLAGAMPTYTMGRAPTPEEAFRNFIYAGGASDALASERILQYARNMGLTPEQTLSLTNNALRGTRVGFPDFTLADYDAAVAKGRGLLAIPEARTAPALSYASPGFTAPSQGGLSAAAAQGMSKGEFYGNINAALQNNLLGPQQVADAMRTYGITADDLIAARAMANTPTTGAATSSTTIPDSATVTERVREGGPIAFAEGDVVKAPVMAGEKAYTLADFGITPATVETARGLGAFTVPRNVLFNPELIKREAAYRKEKGLAGGGDVGRGLGSIAMKGYAQEMAQKGRFGDTMLAHISPEEAQMLQAAGGAGTINPQTGLPEYFSWRKLLKGVGKVLPFVLPFTGIGLGAQALISGLSGAVSGGKGFDFKRGLMSGLMSYGMGSLAQGAGAAANAPTPDITVPQIDTSMNPAFADQAANVVGSGAAPAVNTFKSIADVPLAQMPGQFLENIQAVGQGAMGAATGAPGAREAFTAGQGSVFGKQLTPTMAAGATAVGMGGVKAADEMNQFELQQAMANARTEEERERFRQLFLRTLGPVGFAGGGDIAAMVAGGATGPANEPRTINGAGDGMSDSVPATIEGVQEARLADGEFVIPADVVADLGNGSSNAGSKKLYAMMDRVRKARHGTTRQPPEVDTGRLMPA